MTNAEVRKFIKMNLNEQDLIERMELMKRYAPADEKEEEAFDIILKVLEREWEHQQDQEAHSEVTIDMEEGKLITLREWAEMNKLQLNTARVWAERGKLPTAEKNGRDWFVRSSESIPRDRRFK